MGQLILEVVRIKHKYKILSGIIMIMIGSILSFTFLKSFATEEENKEEEKKYIKWVEFNVTEEILQKTSKLDIDSHTKQEDVTLNWIELLAYLAAKYGGNFSYYKEKDLEEVVSKLRYGESMEEITENMKLYPYYYESYEAILKEFIGTYEMEVATEDGSKSFQEKYGIKAFLPIAKNYGFSHYDDFGASRSYGFKRTHLGNDLMGNIGTPIIAVESGIVEHLGWNQYGGWRVGIRSLDGKRNYY